MSFWDALCPHLGLDEALKVAECTHELKGIMTKNMDLIIRNDKHNCLIRLARVALGTDNIDLKMLKDFKRQILARDMDILLRLHKLPIFYDNKDLQDLYMDHCIFFAPICEDIDQHIQSIMTMLDSQKSNKFACFAFMIRLVTRFIKWVIHNDLQDNLNLTMFNNGNFFFVLRSKMHSFLDRAYIIKDEKQRKDFEDCINENAKYIIACVIKTYAPTVVKLAIEPNGCIYWMNATKRVYL